MTYTLTEGELAEKVLDRLKDARDTGAWDQHVWFYQPGTLDGWIAYRGMLGPNSMNPGNLVDFIEGSPHAERTANTGVLEWDCGTRACFAGHTLLEATAHGYRPGPDQHWEDMMVDLLGLDEWEAEELTHEEASEREILHALERIAKGRPREYE